MEYVSGKTATECRLEKVRPDPVVCMYYVNIFLCFNPSLSMSDPLLLDRKYGQDFLEEWSRVEEEAAAKLRGCLKTLGYRRRTRMGKSRVPTLRTCTTIVCTRISITPGNLMVCANSPSLLLGRMDEQVELAQKAHDR